MVIKDETGEIPWGRMFGVQKWDRAPWATPLVSSMVVFKFLLSFLVIILDALISGWLSLDLHGGYHNWISLIGFLWLHLDNSLDFSDNEV